MGRAPLTHRRPSRAHRVPRSPLPTSALTRAPCRPAPPRRRSGVSKAAQPAVADKPCGRLGERRPHHPDFAVGVLARFRPVREAGPAPLPACVRGGACAASDLCWGRAVSTSGLCSGPREALSASGLCVGLGGAAGAFVLRAGRGALPACARSRAGSRALPAYARVRGASTSGLCVRLGREHFRSVRGAAPCRPRARRPLPCRPLPPSGSYTPWPPFLVFLRRNEPS